MTPRSFCTLILTCLMAMACLSEVRAAIEFPVSDPEAATGGEGSAPHARGHLELTERPAVLIDDLATAIGNATATSQSQPTVDDKERTPSEVSQAGLSMVGASGTATDSTSTPTAGNSKGGQGPGTSGLGPGGPGGGGPDGGGGIDPAPLPNPEPGTIVIWVILAACGAWVVRRGQRK